MDDFYTSMYEVGIIDSQETSNQGSSSSNVIYSADALVPLNPSRWTAFTAGSAAASDMPDLTGKLGTPFANIQVAQEYLATAKSDVQYRDRVWQLAEDTVTINSLCELGGNSGSFVAGALSNKLADEYLNEMVETECTKNLNEELNMEIFRATAKENQNDPDRIRGTGTIRENVPEYMKGDLCDRPKRNERPSEWGNTGGLDEEGIGGPPKPKNSPGGGSSSDSIGSAGWSGSESNISPDETNSNDDNEEGGIFAKCFGWLFAGGSEGQCFDQVPMSPYESERLREEVEDDFFIGGGCKGLDIDHPAYNPPLFLPEIVPPPN